MPIPKPKKGESQDDFIGRCMADPVMKADYKPKQRLAICFNAWKTKNKTRGMQTMAISLNRKGLAHAKSLIAQGKVNSSAAWSFSAADGNRILGDNNWAEYSKWFLGADSSQKPDTRAHWKYPFGKGGVLYRSAVRAIRVRASQQNETDIFNAAGTLMDLLDKKKNKNDWIPEGYESRNYALSEIRLKEDLDANKGPVIEGMAAVFNSLSEELGPPGMGFFEKIAPGAFSRSIKEGADVRALWGHNPEVILGRTKSGTLELEETKNGLHVRIYPPASMQSQIESIRRGDVSQMSFGFLTRKDEWEETDSGVKIRTLKDVDLIDVSPVTFPAYQDTSVAVRKLQDALLDEDIIGATTNDEDAESSTAYIRFKRRMLKMRNRHCFKPETLMEVVKNEDQT